nr:hypothetical protein HK105_007263 [Polyrhizophydium stewartii]
MKFQAVVFVASMLVSSASAAAIPRMHASDSILATRAVANTNAKPAAELEKRTFKMGGVHGMGGMHGMHGMGGMGGMIKKAMKMGGEIVSKVMRKVKMAHSGGSTCTGSNCHKIEISTSTGGDKTGCDGSSCGGDDSSKDDSGMDDSGDDSGMNDSSDDSSSDDSSSDDSSSDDSSSDDSSSGDSSDDSSSY